MKIAIIGAGVCGSYLAQNLAEIGHKVDVFEQKSTIGKECCSGLFSERLFGFIPEARELVTNRISRCIIHFPKKDLKLNFKRPFFIMEHSQLDLLAAALATKAGANVIVREKISIERIEGMKHDYDRIIGCDGALSVVRSYFEKGTVGQPIFLGIQGFVVENDKVDFVETWPTKTGFFWKIPRGYSIEYGIMEQPMVAPKLFEEFIEKRNLKIQNLKSAIIPQGFYLPENDRITLCGDASGLTKPWSGGGVIWNLTQADLLLKNFPDLLKYRSSAKNFFDFQIFVGTFAKKILYPAGNYLWPILPGSYRVDGDFLLR